MQLPAYSKLQAYLDEVNTSSCLGLFKEIIVDRTIDGEVMLLCSSSWMFT